MKLAISLTGMEPGAAVDPHFGRARCFRIVDTGTGERSLWDNAAAAEATHGAGTRTAQALAGLGVAAVLTGHVGPKAAAALEAAGIRVYLAGGGGEEEVIRSFLGGRLQPLGGGGGDSGSGVHGA